MHISPVNQLGSPWRVIGKSGEASLAVSPDGRVKVQAGGQVAVIPLAIALALGTQEAKAFLSDPVVAEFLYAPADRAARVRAAKALADTARVNERRGYVALLVSEGLASEPEAWALARLKYP